MFHLLSTVVAIVVVILSPVLSHPQCLDFRPPFAVRPDDDRPPRFCSEYSEFGCCDRSADSTIKKRYNDVWKSIRSRRRHRHRHRRHRKDDLSTCERYLKQVLCLECSPYAAHLFDAEETQIRRTLPGLCADYCTEFYRKCPFVISYLSRNQNDNDDDDDVGRNVDDDDDGGRKANNEDDQIRNVSSSMTVDKEFCDRVRLTDDRYCYPDLLTNPDLVSGVQAVIEGRTVDRCLCLEDFARGLRNPLLLRSAPDDSGRMFVGEQLGLVHIFYGNGSRLARPFLDVAHLVSTSRRQGDERGFLGLAFHPDFRANSRIYVYYSIRSDVTKRDAIRISEIKVSKKDRNRADETSERVLVEVVQPYWNHNGGEILFGIDGYLYAFIGDGGGAGDPHGHAQNMSSLLGKVIRIDVDGIDLRRRTSYTIPDDNPFVRDPKSRPEIFAFGIRNIWRCDVDEGHPTTGHGRGRIICGDVGQSAFEEINLITKGGNYGWNKREGNSCYASNPCHLIEDEVLPLHVYPHSVGQSVIGGHVYRGCLSPSLQGQYIYGDFMNGKLFRLIEESEEGNRKWRNEELHICGPEVCFNGLVGTYEKHILSFGEDSDGEIYVLTTSKPSTPSPTGKIYRLVDPWRRSDPVECQSKKKKTKNSLSPPPPPPPPPPSPPPLPPPPPPPPPLHPLPLHPPRSSSAVSVATEWLSPIRSKASAFQRIRFRSLSVVTCVLLPSVVCQKQYIRL